MITELNKDIIKVVFFLLILTFLYYILPLAGLLIYIIWPIPVVYMTLKYDFREALITIILAAIINAFFIGFVIDMTAGIFMGMYTIIGFGLIGFLLGAGLKENFSPLKTLVLTITGVFISNTIITFITPYLLDYSYQEIFAEISRSFEQNQMLSEYSYLVEQQLAFLRIIFPSIMIISAVIIGSLIYYITIKYINKRGFNKNSFKPVRYWFFPRILSVLIALILFANSLFFETNVSANKIFINVIFVLLFFVFLQGFAVGLYYLSNIKSSLVTVIYITFIIFFNFIALPGLIILGLIDMWFNIRKHSSD
ncbi:MAG: DUF2232 domain-containing protein [Halanaerobiaceae bacterium]